VLLFALTRLPGRVLEIRSSNLVPAKSDTALQGYSSTCLALDLLYVEEMGLANSLHVST